MTIVEFADQCGKREPTVRGWIEKGYVPGASIVDDYVPNSAREPYTSTRAKKSVAIMKAVLKACNSRRGVVGALFGMGEEEFLAMMNSLEENGYVYSFSEDGVTYYNTTIIGEEKITHKKDLIAIANILAAMSPGFLALL